MNRNRWRTLLVVGAVSTLVLAACSSDGRDGSEPAGGGDGGYAFTPRPA